MAAAYTDAMAQAGLVIPEHGTAEIDPMTLGAAPGEGMGGTPAGEGVPAGGMPAGGMPADAAPQA